jgi:RNA polymerase sigma factor (sigma-70 family)
VKQAAEVFEEHGEFIDAAIRWKAPDESTADDLRQDLFLSLVAQPIPPHVEDVRSFLFKAIVNDARDAIRRAARYRRILKKYGKFADFPVNIGPPTDALELRERVMRLIGMMQSRLDSSEATAIRLTYAEHLTVEEVADEMQVKDRSVSRYLATGLRKMRHIIAAEMDGIE